MQKIFKTKNWLFSFTERSLTGEKLGSSTHLKWSVNSILVHPPFFVNDGVILLKRSEISGNECVKYSLEGHVLWKFNLSDSIDVIFIAGSYILFSMHNRNLAHWQPGSSGLSIEKAIANDWIVQSRRIKDGTLLWSQNKLINGTLVGKSNFETYISIRIMNPDAYYRIGELPVYAIELRFIRNGKLKCGWILPNFYLAKNGFSLTKNDADNTEIQVVNWDRIKPLIKRNDDLLQIIFPDINNEHFIKCIFFADLIKLNAYMKINGRSIALKTE